jgi:hypothetical protein
MLLLTSQKAFLVTLTFEEGIFLGKLANSSLKTLFVKLKATFSLSMFNFEYFYKKKVGRSD